MLGFGSPFARGLWTPAIVAVLRQIEPSLTLLPVALAVMNDLVTDTLARLLDTALPFSCALVDRVDEESDEYFTASHVSVVNAGLVLADGSLDASHTVKLYHSADGEDSHGPGTTLFSVRSSLPSLTPLFAIRPPHPSFLHLHEPSHSGRAGPP
jgi:hypothetical protein